MHFTGIAYQFQVMPNGHLNAMRVFTKILKQAFSCLREQGHSSVIYVDDSLLARDTFLGFDINTVNMTLSLTSAKKNKIKDLCVTTFNPTLTIRQVASLLGNIAASFEAVPYGRLHYQYLEQNKIMALREARGNFENPCTITP